jgi:hypothetical protein
MTLADRLLSEGREEGALGVLIGQVQMLQRLLGRTPDPTSALASLPRAQVESMIASLDQELSERLK